MSLAGHLAPSRAPVFRGRPARGGLLVAGLAVGALMLLPVAYLVLRAAGASTESWDLILRARTLALAFRSIGLAAAVTASAVAIGVPLAWLTARTDLPSRRLWSVLVALPLVIPSYVGAFALIAALGPGGIVQDLLAKPFGVERLPDISGFVGAWLALTLFTYPYVYLLVASGIKGLDPSHEEAARGLGESAWSTFVRVTLPMLRPSIAAGSLLVALYTLHDFGAVSLMRFQTFTQAIYLQYRGAFDRTPAAILSLFLVALALGVLVMEHKARGRARYYRSGAGSKRPSRVLSLGRWKWPALLFCGAVTAAAFALPVSVIAFWLIRGAVSGDGLNLTWAAAGNSVLVSGAGALVALVAALPVALLAVRFPGRSTTVMERLSYSGYALPGIVVALALVFFTANFSPALYQSLPLVVIAYVVLFLPQAVEPLSASLLQLGPRMEEAARALGVRRTRVFARIVAPLIARGLVSGAALVFLTAMKELPATLLLRPTGFETLATRVWTGATAGLYAHAAGPALLLVAACAVPLYVLARRVEVREVEVKAD
ncbi:MAG: iron ABC transporter permease [Actinobacteria bacterium]|nr:iron ABC transporter permease [Actinomycetota bacterium]